MGGKRLKAYLYNWSQSQVLWHGVAETWNLKPGFRFHRTTLWGNVSFYCGTRVGKRVARTFAMGTGTHRSQVTTLKYLLRLVFKSIVYKTCIFWHFFREYLCSDLSRQLLSLFSFNRQVSKFCF